MPSHCLLICMTSLLGFMSSRNKSDWPRSFEESLCTRTCDYYITCRSLSLVSSRNKECSLEAQEEKPIGNIWTWISHLSDPDRCDIMSIFFKVVFQMPWPNRMHGILIFSIISNRNKSDWPWRSRWSRWKRLCRLRCCCNGTSYALLVLSRSWL